MAERGKSENHHGPTGDAAATSAPVFISYASHDGDVAQKVCSALEAVGLPCWMAPRDVKPGAQYADAIVRAINEAKAVVLVLSGSAVGSSHVGREVERAASKHKQIIAFRVDTAALNPGLEYFLSESQWIDVPKLGMPAALTKLADSVGHGSTTSSQETSLGKRAEITKKRIAIAAAAVIGVGVAVALGLHFWVANHGGGQPPAAVAAITDKSIAVLPFVDMSEKKDQEYFADGMAEEIIDLLVKIPGLKVIGRTSSFQFKGKTEDLRSIGTQLGVAYVLEGSVRKSGDRLRVTAQLINTRDGTHLLSLNYDRELSDVLKMQDEIAASLVRALQIEVTATDFISRPALVNKEAYTLYLQGMHAFERYDPQGFEQAVSDFQRALDLDPTFGAAAGNLAGAYLIFGEFGFMPATIAFDKARHFGEVALKLDPNMTGAHALLGNIDGVYDWDWPAAERELKLALAAAPNDTFVLNVAAQMSLAVGRWDDALKLLNRSQVLDPLDPTCYFLLSSVQVRRGRLAEAEAASRRILEISPTFTYAHFNLGLVLLARSEPQAALAEMLKEGDDAHRLGGSAMAYFALGRKADSDSALAQFVKLKNQASPYTTAEVYAFRGESDEAFKWLDRAYAQKDVFLYKIKGEVPFAKLEGDPRFKTFLKKMNFPE